MELNKKMAVTLDVDTISKINQITDFYEISISTLIRMAIERWFTIIYDRVNTDNLYWNKVISDFFERCENNTSDIKRLWFRTNEKTYLDLRELSEAYDVKINELITFIVTYDCDIEYMIYKSIIGERK